MTRRALRDRPDDIVSARPSTYDQSVGRVAYVVTSRSNGIARIIAFVYLVDYSVQFSAQLSTKKTEKSEQRGRLKMRAESTAVITNVALL